MPGIDTRYCSKSLDDLILRSDDRPLVALHVGNFLGVSLSHFVKYVCQRNEKSVVVSIDPNIQHQGVEFPQNHVISILKSFWTTKERHYLCRLLDEQDAKQRWYRVCRRERHRVRSIFEISERAVVRGHVVKSLREFGGKV